MGDLNRRQIPLIKLSLSIIRRPQFLAHIAVCQATLDLAPVLTVIDGDDESIEELVAVGGAASG